MSAMIRITGGTVVVRDAGRRQKLSPSSPRQPFYSRHADQARRPPRTEHVKPYLLATCPVTELLFQSFDIARAVGPPKTDVSWFEAVEFCNALSRRMGFQPVYLREGDDVSWNTDANGYRLPTEAEWQFACRQTDDDTLTDTAWFGENAGGVVHDVATKTPNAFGLYDMLGNVWEWCWDLFDPEVYGEYRVFRGGGFADERSALQPHVRRKSHPTFHVDDVGFRLARNVSESV